MAPYAEAGRKSLLYANRRVNVCDTGIKIIVEVDPVLFPDLLRLHEVDAPMTIESDELGTVYKNGDPTTGPVSIPKSAIFEIIEMSVQPLPLEDSH